MDLSQPELKKVKKYVFERIGSVSQKKFNQLWKIYEELEPVPISENIWDSVDNSNLIALEMLSKTDMEIVQKIARLYTQYFLEQAFRAMKIDLGDPNVAENLDKGNIGTPGRIAKMWVGSSLTDDSELMCGRWTLAPRLATFPNTSDMEIPIVKRVDINALCSHHAAIFSSQWHKDSYAIIAYIPNQYVLGISKLQRVVDWIARRGWLQEDLTKAIYDAVAEAAQTESVYVKLHGIIHSCEKNRGAQTSDGFFNTECYGGLFKDPELRKQVDLNK